MMSNVFTGYNIGCKLKVCTWKIASPLVKIPLLVFMSEIKIIFTPEKIKFSVSFMLEYRKN